MGTMLRRGCALLAVLWSSAAIAGVPTPPAYVDIASGGPLIHIYVGENGAVQIAHVMDGTVYEFYPPGTIPGDGGTLMAIDGVLYAPDFNAHPGGSATGDIGTFTPFTPVSQTAVLGTGTSTDPLRVTTVVGTGTTAVTVTHTDSYIIGLETYRTDVMISNTGTVARNIVLYRAADCFLGGSDSGYGVVDPAIGSVGCSVNANNAPPGRIEQWLPISGGGQYYQARYWEVWEWIATKQPFPNTCRCNELIDNGAGISWNFTLAPGASTTRSHLTTFSPLGTLPLNATKEALTSTVTVGGIATYEVTVSNPNPFDVNLDTIQDTLPIGFTYLMGTTSGAVTSDPTVNGRVLTWTGPVPVLGSSSVTLLFDAMAGTSTGTFFNNAGGTAAGGVAVSPSGDTAPVTVIMNQNPADAGVADSGAPDSGVIDDDAGVEEDAAVAVDAGASTDADTPVDSGAGGVDAEAAPDGTVGPDAGVVADAGTNPGMDASAVIDSGSGSRVDAGDGGSDEGCSCSAERGVDSAPWSALFFLLFAWRRRRR